MQFGIKEKVAELRQRQFRRQLAFVYNQLGLTSARLDLVAAAHRLDLILICDPALPSEGEIGSNARGERVLVVSRPLGHPRARFTVAHELAHELLRRNLLSPVAIEQERWEAIEEAFCDFIAGLLLMPMPILHREVMCLAHQFPNVSPLQYESLAAHFGVSLRSLLLQMSLLQSTRFMFETDTHPGCGTTRFFSSECIEMRAYTHGWDFPRRVRGLCDFERDEQLGRRMRVHQECDGRFRLCVDIDEPTVDWEGREVVIMLERHPRRLAYVRHFLRPARNVTALGYS